jgi:hypothetical protein
MENWNTVYVKLYSVEIALAISGYSQSTARSFLKQEGYTFKCLSYCLSIIFFVTSNVEAKEEMRAYYPFRGRNCLFKSVNRDILARMGTTLLNELKGTTGCSGNEVGSILTFSIGYFQWILSADCVKRFHRVLSQRFRCGLWKTCHCSFNLIPCRDVSRALPMLLNSLISICDIFVNTRRCRCCQSLMPVPLFALYGGRHRLKFRMITSFVIWCNRSIMKNWIRYDDHVQSAAYQESAFL